MQPPHRSQHPVKGEGKSGDATDIRRTAMDLLARREHSTRELRYKLMRRFGDTPVLDEVLSSLADQNLQSDRRYTENFVRQRAGRRYGPLRIRQELREKGVDESEVALALESAQIDWCAVAAEACRKKFGPHPPEDMREKAGRLRFLQYRGFDADSVRRLVDR